MAVIAWTRRFAAEHRWLTLIAGGVVFGTLMAVRAEAPEWWQRALIAAAAGAVFALTIASRRRFTSDL